VGSNFCICLTATPDDNVERGLEKSDLSAIGFHRFEDDQASSALTIDKNIKLDGALGIFSFIMKKSESGPVLLYCTVQLKAYLQ
jgi:hypothetical protein